MAEINDLARIIDGCKNGNSESFEKLLSLYSGKLYGYFFRLTNNRSVSDDLLSELFVKLVEKIKFYRGGNFDAWIFKIASNIFNDYLRAKQRDKRLGTRLDDLDLDQIKTPEKETSPDTTDKIQTILETLDSDTRELVMLRFYGQLSFKELAELRREPIGTVLSKVHRGLKTIRQMLE
ncbi:MAG: RNA polymerase sigma factor [Phycisphaerae bacterium]